MAAIGISPGRQLDDSVGTTPPWLRQSAPGMSSMGAMGGGTPTPNYASLASAMTGINPMGGGGGTMGATGGFDPWAASRQMAALGNANTAAGSPPGESGTGHESGTAYDPGTAPMVNAGPGGGTSGSPFDPWAASRALSGANPVSVAGSPLGAGGTGTAPGVPPPDMTQVQDSNSGGGPQAGSNANPGTQQDNLRQTIESAYNNASGTGSSALQRAPATASTAPGDSGTVNMAKSASAGSTPPISASTTPQAISDPGPAASAAPNSVLSSYMQTGGGPSSGAATPAPSGSPLAPASSPNAAPGSANAAPSNAGTSGTPGVTLGSQSAYAGGPSVTTSNVNYSTLPSLSTDFSGDAQRGADAAYKGATQYFDTDFGRQNSDLQNQLAAQGFAPGTEGYDRQMELMQRGQNQARTQAASQAQQVGFQQSGDLMQRALAARQQGVSELNTSADRSYNQSLGIAGLGLGARGQDLGLQGAQAQASATTGAAGINAAAGNYRADLDSQLGLRQLGLQQDNQDWSHALSLAQMGQSGVPGLNFGPANPLDVGSAYGIASQNNQAAQNRGASNTNALYTLGGNLLGSYFRNP